MHKDSENPGKKLQIATGTESERGQIKLQGDEPFCICWQELASVFRCNILSVAEEPLRKNVAGKSSKEDKARFARCGSELVLDFHHSARPALRVVSSARYRAGSDLAEARVT